MTRLSRFATDEEIETLLQMIKDLPELIYGKDREIRQQDSRGLQASLDACRSEIFSEVATEVGENKKPKFSNKELRDAETERRLANNEEYKAMKTLADEAQLLTKQLWGELYRMKDTLKACCARADLLGKLIELESKVKTLTGDKNE